MRWSLQRLEQRLWLQVAVYLTTQGNDGTRMIGVGKNVEVKLPLRCALKRFWCGMCYN